jgi:hypothetical protein
MVLLSADFMGSVGLPHVHLAFQKYREIFQLQLVIVNVIENDFSFDCVCRMDRDWHL